MRGCAFFLGRAGRRCAVMCASRTLRVVLCSATAGHLKGRRFRCKRSRTADGVRLCLQRVRPPAARRQRLPGSFLRVVICVSRGPAWSRMVSVSSLPWSGTLLVASLPGRPAHDPAGCGRACFQPALPASMRWGHHGCGCSALLLPRGLESLQPRPSPAVPAVRSPPPSSNVSLQTRSAASGGA